MNFWGDFGLNTEKTLSHVVNHTEQKAKTSDALILISDSSNRSSNPMPDYNVNKCISNHVDQVNKKQDDSQSSSEKSKLSLNLFDNKKDKKLRESIKIASIWTSVNALKKSNLAYPIIRTIAFLEKLFMTETPNMHNWNRFDYDKNGLIQHSNYHINVNIETMSEGSGLTNEQTYHEPDTPVMVLKPKKRDSLIEKISVFSVGHDKLSKVTKSGSTENMMNNLTKLLTQNKDNSGYGIKVSSLTYKNKNETSSLFTKILSLKIKGESEKDESDVLNIKFPSHSMPFTKNQIDKKDKLLTEKTFVFLASMKSKDFSFEKSVNEGGFWVLLFSQTHLLFLVRVDYSDRLDMLNQMNFGSEGNDDTINDNNDQTEEEEKDEKGGKNQPNSTKHKKPHRHNWKPQTKSYARRGRNGNSTYSNQNSDIDMLDENIEMDIVWIDQDRLNDLKEMLMLCKESIDTLKIDINNFGQIVVDSFNQNDKIMNDIVSKSFYSVSPILFSDIENGYEKKSIVSINNQNRSLMTHILSNNIYTQIRNADIRREYIAKDTIDLLYDLGVSKRQLDLIKSLDDNPYDVSFVAILISKIVIELTHEIESIGEQLYMFLSNKGSLLMELYKNNEIDTLPDKNFIERKVFHYENSIPMTRTEKYKNREYNGRDSSDNDEIPGEDDDGDVFMTEGEDRTMYIDLSTDHIENNDKDVYEKEVTFKNVDIFVREQQTQYKIQKENLDQVNSLLSDYSIYDMENICGKMISSFMFIAKDLQLKLASLDIFADHVDKLTNYFRDLFVNIYFFDKCEDETKKMFVEATDPVVLLINELYGRVSKSINVNTYKNQLSSIDFLNKIYLYHFYKTFKVLLVVTLDTMIRYKKISPDEIELRDSQLLNRRIKSAYTLTNLFTNKKLLLDIDSKKITPAIVASFV